MLLMIVLLAVILLEFNYEARVNFHAADNSHRSRQALYCAEAGIAIAIAAIEQREDIASEESLSRLLAGAVRVPVGDGYCTVRVEEENGKINVNSLKSGDDVDRRKVDQLLHLIDILNRQYGDRSPIGYGIVPAIIDWTDPDNDVTYVSFIERENEGAEREYYERQTPSRGCKSAPFDTVDELLLVRGMTREIFEGRPGNETTGTSAVTGMRRLLTVYGDGKIDLNRAPPEVIESLSEDMTPMIAQAIVAHQQPDAPFESVAELVAIPGITPDLYASISELITVEPQVKYYRVTATGHVQDFSGSIIVILRKTADGTVTRLLRQEP